MKSLALLIFAAGMYGFSVGLAHSFLYATRNLIKLPLLLLVTASICTLAYFVVSRFCGVGLPLRSVQGLALELFRDTALLLASLTPVNLLLAVPRLLEEAPTLGDYDFYLVLNITFVSVCGCVALVRQSQALFQAAAVPKSRGLTIVGLWLALSLVVGGQASFYLRPFFGVPSSRGMDPPWLLGSQADPRGATNFFEVVLQSLGLPGDLE